MKRAIIILGVFLFIMAALSPCYTVVKERTEPKIGTFVTIKLRSFFWFDFDTAFSKAFAAFDNINDIASVYNKDSEVAKLNANAYKYPVPVNEDLFKLLKESIELSRQSDGAFDITVAPLVALWRSCKDTKRLPTEAEIKNALSRVGYKYIILDEEKKTVFFSKENVSVNLSAIAKGYAVDKAIKVIKKSGIKSAIISAGGDLYCLGKNNFYGSWRIGIADPANKRNIKKVLLISDKGVATSGGYEQYFTLDGRSHTHLINPKTGLPLENRFSSVTVLAPNCMLADGIATAVSVGGRPLVKKFKDLYAGVEIITDGLN